MIANEDAGREWECFFARLKVNKYMKEILGNIKQQTLLLLLSMVMFVMLFVPLAGAEVYKCKSADGKTSFSDQPCATGQNPAVIKPQTVGVDATSSSKADYKSRPEYPECLRLRNKIADYYWDTPQIKPPPKNRGELTVGDFMGGKTVLAEIRKDMARYKEICSVFDKENMREQEESAREEERKQELAEKPQRDAEDAARCTLLRKELAELRIKGPAHAKSTDRRTEEEVLEIKKYIAEIERRIPGIEKEIEKSCKPK